MKESTPPWGERNILGSEAADAAYIEAGGITVTDKWTWVDNSKKLLPSLPL